MPLNPGNDSVIFIKQAWNGTPDRYGVTGPVGTQFPVSGCSMQPAGAKEHLGDTLFAEATDHCIAPSNAVTLAAQQGDIIQGATGNQYRILGVNTYRDGWGRNSHITFVCKWEEG